MGSLYYELRVKRPLPTPPAVDKNEAYLLGFRHGNQNGGGCKLLNPWDRRTTNGRAWEEGRQKGSNTFYGKT